MKNRGRFTEKINNTEPFINCCVKINNPTLSLIFSVIVDSFLTLPVFEVIVDNTYHNESVK